MNRSLIRNLEVLEGALQEPLGLSSDVYAEPSLLAAARDLGIDIELTRGEDQDLFLSGVPAVDLDRVLNAALLGHAG